MTAHVSVPVLSEQITVQQPKVSVNGNTYDSITDDFCKDQATEFAIPDNESSVYSYDFNEFGRKGGMQSLSDSMDRGMVLVMSLRDDTHSNMLWLDSDYPPDIPPNTQPGISRGPCSQCTYSPELLEGHYAGASVIFKNIRIARVGDDYMLWLGSGW